MAQVPKLTERETYSGKGSRSGSLAGEQISAKHIPFVEDKSLDHASALLDDIGERMTRMEETDQANRAVIALRKGADAIQEKAKTEWVDMSLDEHINAFEYEWEALDKNVDELIKSNNVKRKLMAERERAKLVTQAEVRNLGRNRVNDRLIASSIETKDYLLNGAINAEHPEDVLNNIQAAYGVNENLVAVGAISAEQAAIDNERISDAFNMGHLKRYVDTTSKVNPFEPYLKFKSKNPGKVFNELDEDAKDELTRYALSKGRETLYLESQLEAYNAKALKKRLEENDYNAVINFKEGMFFQEGGREQLIQGAKNRLISRPMFEKLIKELDSGTEIIGGPDELKAVGDLADKIEMGLDVRDKVKKAYVNHKMSRTNYLTFMQRMGDAEYQQGLKQINIFSKPLPNQRITQTDALRWQERNAQDLMVYNYLVSGEKPSPERMKQLGEPEWYNVDGPVKPSQAAEMIRQRHHMKTPGQYAEERWDTINKYAPPETKAALEAGEITSWQAYYKAYGVKRALNKKNVKENVLSEDTGELIGTWGVLKEELPGIGVEPLQRKSPVSEEMQKRLYRGK
jgi:hypothetical protein